jgi:hypothetical protein
MADVQVLTSMWAIVVVQLALQAGIVANAYRLTKLTGRFRAWTMIILSFLLTAVSSVFGVVYLLMNPDTIASLIGSFDIGTLMLSYGVSIATSLLLFFGTFDLVRKFKRAAKNPDTSP